MGGVSGAIVAAGVTAPDPDPEPDPEGTDPEGRVGTAQRLQCLRQFVRAHTR